MFAQATPRWSGSRCDYNEFNPLGPPLCIASLAVGEVHSIPLLLPEWPEQQPLRVIRLSRNPDIFLLQNLLASDEQRMSLIQTAKAKGLKAAGTRKSEDNSVRKDSYLAWINPNENILDEVTQSAGDTAQDMMDVAKTLFVHESLLTVDEPGYFSPEEVQVAMYDEGGCFDLHHDGSNRFLTVITYLNGVGGTYFPFAQTSGADIGTAPVIKMEGNGAEALSAAAVPGKDGLLIAGKEWNCESCSSASVPPGAVVRIQPGDAVAFYNYHLGQDQAGEDVVLCPETDVKEWRALHASLATPREKWIATNWFRSDNLTGPFAGLYRERLLDGTC